MKRNLFLSLSLLFFAITASADQFIEGYFQFSGPYSSSEYDDQVMNITGLSPLGRTYISNNTSLTIPGNVTYNGTRYRVNTVMLGYDLTNNTTLTTIRVSPGVAIIGSECFKSCLNLVYIFLPSTLKEIYPEAFTGSTKLARFYFAGTSVPKLYSSSFTGTASTAYAYGRNGNMVNKFKQNSIMKAKFANNIFKSVSAADFVWNDQYYGITSYRGTTAASDVELLGANSAVTAVNTSAQISKLDHSANGLVTWYNLTTIADSAFRQNTYVKTLYAGNSSNAGSALFKIGKSAFEYSNLTTATIDADTIMQDAFYGATDLKTVSFKKGTYNRTTKYIGMRAFNTCESMTSIQLPASLSSLGTMVFVGCKNLASITVASGNNYFSSQNGSLFNYSKTTLLCCPPANANLTIPNTVISIGQCAVQGNSKITLAVIPHGVKTIGGQAFWGCSKLATIRIPSSVTSLGTYAFGSCTALQKVYCAMDNPPAGNPFYQSTSLGNIKLYRPFGYNYFSYSGQKYDVPWNAPYFTNYQKHTYWGQMNEQVDSAAYDLELENCRYILNPTTRQAALVGAQNMKKGSYKISDTFTYNGIAYTTTIVADSAFLYLGSNATFTGGAKVKIVGECSFFNKKGAYMTHFPFTNAEHILPSAFYNQYNMVVPTLELEKAYTIWSYAFAKCKKITKVITGEKCQMFKMKYRGNESYIYNPFDECYGLVEAFIKYNIPNSAIRQAPANATPDDIGYASAIHGATFSDHNDNLVVYIDYRNKLAMSYSYTQPFYVSDDKWQSFAATYKIQFDTSGPSLYRWNYTSDSNSKPLKLQLVKDYSYDNGYYIVNATPGIYYKMTKTEPKEHGVTSDPHNMECESLLEDIFYERYSTAANDSYVVESDSPYMRRLPIDNTEKVPRGQLVISWPRNFTQQQANIQLLLPDEGGMAGDVNGDGFVTAADVTALYDYMLNNNSSNIVNGDQDGDGHITAGDITAVYNILLGN